MAEANPHELLDTFSRHGCSAILRTDIAEAVAPAMRAAVDGGFRIVEFTLNTPGALTHIEAFAQMDDLTVGAGTVLSIEDAEAAVAAGARFLVSPVADPEIIQWCVERDVLVIPGAMTPAEMLDAWRAGAHLIKLFPGPPGGAQFVQMVRGPLPFLRIFPTSGVTEENVGAYLAAGSFGVGFVNCLFDREDLQHGRFAAIRERAQAMVRAVDRART